MAADRADHLSVLATLRRADGTTAELRPDGVWHSRDARWAEALNMRFDPSAHRLRSVGGMPGYVGVVARAAAYFDCAAAYPWTGAATPDGVVR